MKDELKSLSLAVVLSFIAIYSVNHFFGLNNASSYQKAEINQIAQKLEKASELARIEEETLKTTEELINEERRINIENSAIKGTIRLMGGRFDNILLEKYSQTLDDESKKVELFAPNKTENPYFAELGWLSLDNNVVLPKSNSVWNTDDVLITPQKPAILTWNNDKGLKFIRKIQIDENYFVNASENFEEWNAWFTVFDAQVTAANGAQNAWNSYVGILRLGQWLANTPPVTWKDSMNQALIEATQIKIPLVTEYKLGDEFELLDLVIEDGRTFLGWYDQEGNKVEKITPTTQGNLVLTAKWSEAVPVESFEVTNQVDRLMKFSKLQLNWVIGPSNATFKDFVWVSSDPSIVTVDQNGNIRALKQGTVEIAQESQRAIVDLETVQYTNEQLIGTLDEVLRIQEEGRQKRLDAESELLRIENELKQKLLETRGKL